RHQARAWHGQIGLVARIALRREPQAAAVSRTNALHDLAEGGVQVAAQPVRHALVLAHAGYGLQQVEHPAGRDLQTGVAPDHPQDLERALHLAAACLRLLVFTTDAEELIDRHARVLPGDADEDVPVHAEAELLVESADALPGGAEKESGRL